MHAGDSPEDSSARRPRRPGDRAAESKLLASIVDSSDDAIFSKTLDGVITTWNKAAERIYGYQADGDNRAFRLAPDAARPSLTRWPRSWTGSAPVSGSITTRPRDAGRMARPSRSRSPFRPFMMRPAESSARRHRSRHHRTRARSRSRLRSASEYARSLIEASLDPLVTISAEGKITDVNEAAIRVTGVERAQLVGTDFSDYFTEPDRAREGYRQVFAQGFVTDYPLTIRHTDGDLTDVLYNASVYRTRASARRVRRRPRRHRPEAESEVAKQRARNSRPGSIRRSTRNSRPASSSVRRWWWRTRTWRRSPTRSPMICAPRCGR